MRFNGGYMKFLKIIFLLIICCVCLGGCFTSDPLERDDLKDFSPMCSNYGVTRDIIPENFIDNFAYTNGYFCYFCYGKSSLFSISDRALLYFEYDNETYYQAKEYVFENLNLSDSPVEEYNEYVFYDNYTGTLPINFPYSFMRVAYNDSNNTLIFIGCYMSSDFDQNIDELSNNWEEFLKRYYNNWYDFSQ